MVHHSTLLYYELTISDGKTESNLFDCSVPEENYRPGEENVELYLDSLVMEAPEHLVNKVLAMFK